MARRRPVATARHRRRRADRLRTPATARVADHGRPVAATCLGHRPGVRRPGTAGRRAARASSWPARRRSRSARRWRASRSGGILGLGLGIIFVHSRLAERAFVPYVVASQTVPILAIAPLVVVALKADWLSVMAVATYLTFFPVTIASMRGLRAFDPRALELFRSYAATRRQVLWQLRLPTSVPYLFSGFRVAAAASVIGAIIGEQTAGVASGLGSAIINYNQYYTSGPERLWATIVMCTARRLRLRGHRQPGRARPHARPLPAGGGTPVTHRADDGRRPRGPGDRRRGGRRRQGVRRRRRRRDRARIGRPDHPPGRVRVAHRAVGLRQVDAAPAHRRPDPADHRDASRQRQAGRAGRGCDRDYGMVFQAPVLMDWRTIAKNIELPLEIMGFPAEERRPPRRRPAQARRARGASPSAIPGSCRAGCSSASRSPGRSRSTRSCC